MHPIKNAPGFMKDPETGVVINTNTSEYNIILEKRRHQKEIKKVNSEVDSLKEELAELKNMLKKVVENK